jgi:hypothetical protein
LTLGVIRRLGIEATLHGGLCRGMEGYGLKSGAEKGGGRGRRLSGCGECSSGGLLRGGCVQCTCDAGKELLVTLGGG